MDPAAILERVLDRPRVVTTRAVLDVYGRAAGGLLANGLAFAALFAVIPVALVTFGLAGALASDQGSQAALAAALARALPPLADLIGGSLAALSSGAVIVSAIGLVGLLWTVSRFYVTLDVAFARVFSAHPERGAVRRNARSVIWVAILLAGVVAILVVGSLVVGLAALLPDRSPVGSVIVAALASPAFLTVVTVTILGLAYRIVPPRSPSWRAVRLPAVAVGLAIVALGQAFAFLAPRLVGVAAVAGPLGAAFIALAWLSLTFQALLIGAAWVRVRDERAGSAGGSALAGPAAPTEARGGRE
jgi:YihY family inner membrane protein